jgi:uncharacterized protein YjbJ (UPF0337 family)
MFALTTALAQFVAARATCLGHNLFRHKEGPAMGEKSDKITGRAKQAVGAVIGDEETKREGERQENKGRLKGKLDSTAEKAQDALEDLKDKVEGK